MEIVLVKTVKCNKGILGGKYIFDLHQENDIYQKLKTVS